MYTQNSSPPCLRVSFAPEIARNGFVFLPRWREETSSEDIANAVGRRLAFKAAPAVHDIVPKTNAGPNTYSGIYKLGEFPFHTDMAHWRTPPRYLMLRCLKGHASVVTDLIDGLDIVESIGPSILSRALVKPRRPLNGSIPLFSLFRPATPGRSSMLRWDEVFIVPASPAGERGFNSMKEEMAAAQRVSIALQSEGDTLLIDNWRMAHARSAVSVDQTDRVIQRSYFGELY